MNGITPMCKDSHLTLQGNLPQRSKIIVQDTCDFFLGSFFWQKIAA